MHAGSVFDRPFDANGVAALTGLTATEVGDSIERLVERGLLAVGDGDQVAPTHVLIRDVAYAGLPRARRAVLHRAVAQWLIGQSHTPEPASTELIAVHYREAALLATKLEQTPPELGDVRELAVEWLVRAADSALSAAATSEAVDRLRAAAELAAPEEQAAIYERIGDAGLDAQTSLQSYRRAIATQVGPSPDERFRVVAKLVQLVTRSWGGVGYGPSRAELEEVLNEGAGLVPQVTDELAIGQFLVGRAFVPFWSGDPITRDERAGARDDAQRGLAIAARLADSNLRSAALDALGSLADTWAEGLAFERQRLAFPDHLELSERIDAHSTAAWAACVTGELVEAERITAAGLALLEPGQVPAYALHLAAWRIGVLRRLGRWDELEAPGEFATDSWEATGRSAAGYALRGFADLLEVARARADERAVARYVRIIEEIYQQLPGEPGTRRNEVLLAPTVEAMAGHLADLAPIIENTRVYGQIDGYERVANRFFDAGGRVDADAWQRLVDASLQTGCRMMAVQALRGVGLSTSSAESLDRALSLARSAAAEPLAARLMIELGGLRGDASLQQEGRATLRDIGDLEYLERKT
jgi:hypothetical protein